MSIPRQYDVDTTTIRWQYHERPCIQDQVVAICSRCAFELQCILEYPIMDQDKVRHIINFFSSTKPVYDIAWSPNSSTVFASVNEGSVAVWDLNTSTKCLVVGDSEGQVTVLQLRTMAPPPSRDKQMDSLLKIINTSLSSQLQNQSASESTQPDREETHLEDDLPPDTDQKDSLHVTTQMCILIRV
ncbi:hypothetical protein DPMN_040699 [Dreissena polymorpha]|uniref:Dynein axonemal intermediate chain 4 n=1 Tax=Dreissena polymorpha TaxID=45954 RepID=A0A9D4HTB9_DREPO|nr:hypothetical protein DPMN_040699 [Dreissena polymorpha]